ncbi:MAG: hypothetical protein Q8L57_02355 [bacterium]|nr:hypothetical protein [bacterium]
MRKIGLGLVLLFTALTLSAVYSPVLAADSPAVIIEPAKPEIIVFNTLEDLIADIEIAPCSWSKENYIYQLRSVPSHYFDQITIKAVPHELEIKTVAMGNSSQTDFTVELFFDFKDFILEQSEERTPQGTIRQTQVKVNVCIQFIGTSTFNLYLDQDKLKETARIIEKAVINKTPLTFVISDIYISSPLMVENFNKSESTNVVLKMFIKGVREEITTIKIKNRLLLSRFLFFSHLTLNISLANFDFSCQHLQCLGD